MFVNGLGTANPPRRYTKSECWEAFKTSEWFLKLDRRSHMIAETVLTKDNGIDSRALALAWEVLRGELAQGARRGTLLAFDRVFGLELATWRPKQEFVPETVRALAEARAAARAAKNWAAADRLLDELHAAGWEMEDRADGYALKRS